MENEEKNIVAEEQPHYGRVDVIAEWKRRRAEDESKFQEWLKSPEKEEVLKDLRRRNAEKGVIIP